MSFRVAKEKTVRGQRLNRTVNFLHVASTCPPKDERDVPTPTVLLWMYVADALPLS